jgi:hypothetical protein
MPLLGRLPFGPSDAALDGLARTVWAGVESA